MGRQRRHRGVVILLLLAGWLLTACGEDEDSTMKNTADRPSMETVIDDYTQMRTEMVAAVDAIAGSGAWVNSSSIKELSRSACRNGEDPDGERANLPNYTRKGPLTGDDRDAIMEAVWKVGRAHGFDEVGTIVDRPDDWEIYGQDPNGGRYVVGSSANTVISIGTGCHRWDTEPAPAPAPSGIPDHAKKDKG